MPDSNDPTTARLRHGSDWAAHEDCIIGNEQGLRNLRDAIDSALRDGESFQNGLDEWVGVKQVDSEWFEDPKDEPSSKLLTVVVFSAFWGVVVLALIGITSVVRWIL